MLFNSYEFIFVFLPITFFIYFMLNHKGFTRVSIIWLMCASLSFYGYWDIGYLPLLLMSIGFNYCLSGFIIKARRKNIESFALKPTKKNLQNLSLDSYMLGLKLGNANQSKESNTSNDCYSKVLKNETKYKNIESKSLIILKPKLLLFIALTFNIALLGYFKYMNFFLETIEYIFHKDILTLNIILPLGISFFTITQIAYLVDCYEGVVEERSLINYALFVTFFPHLIAGPILHHAEMMPQFTNKNNKVLNHKNITRGIFIFSIGLFKKVVIADSFSIWANAGFGVVDSGRFLNIFESWATSLSYTFQLYFDFSGYCDMAIGLGLLFNIMLPINFYSPYKSLNITEFWRKWHITLGRFLKSYIYIPLGGNRNDKHNRDTNKDYIDKRRINKYIYTKLKIEHIHNKIFTLRNLFIVACISGVWHGAGIGFIIWGILHGIAMVIHRIYSWWIDSIRDSKDNDAKNNKIRGILISFLDSKIYKILCWIVTFNFINITWVFFRAENLQGALNLLKGMFGIVWVEIPHKARLVPHFLENIYGRNDTLIYIVLAFIMCLGLKNSVEITGKFRVNAMWAIFTMVILYTSVIILIINPYSEFIYFSF